MSEEGTYFITSPSEAREAVSLVAQWLSAYVAETYNHGKKFQVHVEVTEIS